MNTRRAVLILGAALPLLASVVLLRAETARLNYVLARMDQRSLLLRDALRDSQLELARLRDPQRIRERVLELRSSGGPAETVSAPPPPKPKPKPETKRPSADRRGKRGD